MSQYDLIYVNGSPCYMLLNIIVTFFFNVYQGIVWRKASKPRCHGRSPVDTCYWSCMISSRSLYLYNDSNGVREYICSQHLLHWAEPHTSISKFVMWTAVIINASSCHRSVYLCHLWHLHSVINCCQKQNTNIWWINMTTVVCTFLNANVRQYLLSCIVSKLKYE